MGNDSKGDANIDLGTEANDPFSDDTGGTDSGDDRNEHLEELAKLYDEMAGDGDDKKAEDEDNTDKKASDDDDSDDDDKGVDDEGQRSADSDDTDSDDDDSDDDDSDADPDAELEVPSCLDKDEVSTFKELPEDARDLAEKFIRRRDLAFQRYVTKVSSEARSKIEEITAPYAEIREVAAQNEKRLAMSGRTLASAFKTALTWEQLMDEDPLDALAQLSSRTNVSPRELYDYMTGGTGGTPEGSNGSNGSNGLRNSHYDSRLERLEQQNQELHEALQTQATQVQQGSRQQLREYVDQLALSTDASGDRIYPYFEDVRADMSVWVSKLGAEKPELSLPQLVQEAYDAAVWANGNTRALMLKERIKVAKKPTVTKSQKRAASSLSSSSKGGVSGSDRRKTPPSSYEEEILAAMDELGVDIDL